MAPDPEITVRLLTGGLCRLLDLWRLGAAGYHLADVVDEDENHKNHQEDETYLHHSLFDGAGKGEANEAEYCFEQEHEYQAAVEDRNRQEVKDPEVERQ